MITRETLKEQLRGSIEVIIALIAVIIGSILSVIIVGDVVGDNIINIINDNYGPYGLFNLGLPDFFWFGLLVALISFAAKFAISLMMPIVLPFYGYCPKCGVKPLPEEIFCSECGTNLYRKRVSKFDVRMYIIVTAGLVAFILLWYFLAQIVGIREGVYPEF